MLQKKENNRQAQIEDESKLPQVREHLLDSKFLSKSSMRLTESTHLNITDPHLPNLSPQTNLGHNCPFGPTSVIKLKRLNLLGWVPMNTTLSKICLVLKAETRESGLNELS